MKQISSLEEYHSTCKYSVEHPENFWADVAENFSWKKKWDKVFSGGFEKVDYKWFEAANSTSLKIVLTVTYNHSEIKPPLSGSRTILLRQTESFLTKNCTLKFAASAMHSKKSE